VGSKEGKDGRERGDIVRGRARFLCGEVDVLVSTEDGDKYVLVPAARFNGQRATDRLGRMPLTRRGKKYG
jgi:hypothetical protein